MTKATEHRIEREAAYTLNPSDINLRLLQIASMLEMDEVLEASDARNGGK